MTIWGRQLVFIPPMHNANSSLEATRESLSEGYLIVAMTSVSPRLSPASLCCTQLTDRRQAWIWDFLLGIQEDVRVFSHRKFRPYDVAYVMAR